MNDQNPLDAFVQYLGGLAEKENRGALAALRRGLGKEPGEAPEMFPYVVPFLPKRPSAELEVSYYLAAALFALHPQDCQEGNLGSHLRSCIRSETDEAAIERRFVALLKSHPDDLPNMLRQTVSFLKSKDKRVNYRQLLRDLLGWGSPECYVQRRWASGFWGSSHSESREQRVIESDSAIDQPEEK
jgi:CRISPR system Cascade subunit CasB